MDNLGVGLNGQSVERVEERAIGRKFTHLCLGIAQLFQDKVFIRDRFGPLLARRLKQLTFAHGGGVKRESRRCVSLSPYLGRNNVQGEGVALGHGGMLLAAESMAARALEDRKP